MRAVLLAAGNLVLVAAAGGAENLGVFESHDDIGPVRSVGHDADEFHFAWRRMSGNSG